MRIGRYTLGERLGEGGCGAVHRARADDGREVAIKILHRTGPEAVARFERERRLLASFSQADGFVPLLDWSGEGASPWLAMPLLRGTLRDRLASGPLAPDEARALLVKVARAMALAHARGIVHRDLKPENILLTEEGEPLVADLGIARHFRNDVLGGSDSVSLTRADTFLGTAGYSAPEQMKDAASAGPAADVFALGAILYEALAGRPAFIAPNVLELCSQRERGILPPLEGLPADLALVVTRALATSPARRHRDALAFANALEPSAPPRRATPLLAGSVALGAVVVAGALAVFAFALRGRTATPPPTPERARPPSPPSGPQPATRSATPAEQAEGFMEKGAALRKRFLETKDEALLDESSDAFGAALELDPTNHRAWFARGWNRYMYKRDLEGAELDFDHACKLLESCGHIAHRGWVRAQRGRLDEALADLDHALVLERGTLPLRWRSLVREGLGDIAGALADVEEIVRREPPDGTQRKLVEPRLEGLRERVGR